MNRQRPRRQGSQLEQAQQEQTAAQSITATVERVEHFKKLRARFSELSAAWLRHYLLSQFLLAWPIDECVLEDRYATDGEMIARYETTEAIVKNYRRALGWKV